MKRFFVFISVVLALTACGQKGPLYLPEAPDEPPVVEDSEDE